MPLAKKEGKVISAKIRMDIYEQLEDYCEAVGQTKTTAIERILKNHFDEFFNKDKNE